LVLMSPYDPNAGFNVGHAMQRNKLIYALADAALVVSSDLGKGGTWAGAVEQLDKLRFVPVFVPSTGESSPGITALRQKGALLWPDTQDADAVDRVFGVAISASPPLPSPPSSLALFSGDGSRESEAVSPVATAAPTPADALFATVQGVLHRLLNVPMKEAEVASALNVSLSQAKVWLQRLVDKGVLKKQKKPAGYIANQSGLFE
jgi:DNA processing protein